MEFDLDQRTASLSVGEFSAFVTGPRDSSGGPQGVWRAQLGTRWHNELRSQAAAEEPATEFEIPITGRVVHHGWTLTLTGRIDQLLRGGGGVLLREIKTVTRELPADESELRAAYPDYLAQLGAYVALTRLGALADLTSSAAAPQVRAELCFVEVASGLAQTVPLTPADEAFFRVQLERVTEFLDLRHRARERLRHLVFRPAFAHRRPGQETTEADLTATFTRHPLVLFEAPTGFGKTGVLLEFALGQLRSGHFDRLLYLTSKSTGQIQVVRTLAGMTGPSAARAGPRNSGNPLGYSSPSVGPGPSAGLAGRRGRGNPSGYSLPGTSGGTTAADGGDPGPGNPFGYSSPPGAGRPAGPAETQTPGTAVAVWHVRNKSEHCINHTFHCVSDGCVYLADAAARWPKSGLARFYVDEHTARDLDSLRAAGREAKICPYEITRAALAFNDVWIGDYNYVFAPRNRGLFFEQPGFVAARTLLVLDEAHNLPSRVADAYSHDFTATDAWLVRDALHRTRPVASLVTAWDHWCHFLDGLKANHGLPADTEDDARHLLSEIARHLSGAALDLAALGPQVSDLLWTVPSVVDEFAAVDLPRLWWAPVDGELAITCLDAAAAIGQTLREFGGVVLASATLSPVDGFAAACGLAALEFGAAESAREEPEARPAAPERLGALNKRATKKLYRQLTTGAALLRVEEARDAARPALVRAHTPWRDDSYDVAFDARVDTTFQHRSAHFTTTAATIAALQRAAALALSARPAAPGDPANASSFPDRGAATPSSRLDASTANIGARAAASTALPCVAVFFPSYAYAEAIRRELGDVAPALRVALQPRVRDLAAQAAWVNESLLAADALLLVLGSSFAESIDALGGRITHAMVVGPALPEVNPVQRARLAEAARAGLSREESFRRVYQIPGMTKVNQALGRLVRAPGQRARVILHCRRFLEPSYADLLAPDYQHGVTVTDDAELTGWLERPLAGRGT